MAKTNTMIAASNGETARRTVTEMFPEPLDGVITVTLKTKRVVETIIGELSMFYDQEEIPDDLTPIAAFELYGPAKIPDAEQGKRTRDRLRLYRWLCTECMGRAAKLRGRNESLPRLYDAEVWELARLVNNPARALANFRGEPDEDVELVQALQGMGAAA